MKIFWLSFVVDGRNAGVAIVEADNAQAAVFKTHRLGINPGGEVQIVASDHPGARAECEKLGFDRLVPPDELKALGYETERERQAREAS